MESQEEIDSRVINAIKKEYNTAAQIKKYIRRNERAVKESIERLLEQGVISQGKIKRSIVYSVIETEQEPLDELDIIV